MRPLFVLSLVMLFAGSALAYPGQEFMVNGNFETGDLSGWGWNVGFLFPTIITDTPPEGPGPGIGGAYAASVANNGDQWFTQNFYFLPNGGFGDPLPAPKDLVLDFWFTGAVQLRIYNTFSPTPRLFSGDVFWTYYADFVPPNPDNGEWTHAETYSVGSYPQQKGPIPWLITVPAGTVNLTIEFNPQWGTMELDNVRLREWPIPAVPVPPALGLLGVGLLGFLLRRRR